MDRRNAQPVMTWNMTAAVATWLLPGLGHYLIGERRRGSILAATVGTIWLAGLLIGGVSVIDRRDHPAWFLGQMLLAPSVVVDFGHQYLRNQTPNPVPNPTSSPPYEPSFGQVYEQGMLYTLLAGLMNLLAIMDVAYHHQVRPAGRREDGERSARAAIGDAP